MRGERLIEWTDPASVLRHVHELERAGQGSDDSENWKRWARAKIENPDGLLEGLFWRNPKSQTWHLMKHFRGGMYTSEAWVPSLMTLCRTFEIELEELALDPVQFRCTMKSGDYKLCQRCVSRSLIPVASVRGMERMASLVIGSRPVIFSDSVEWALKLSAPIEHRLLVPMTLAVALHPYDFELIKNATALSLLRLSDVVDPRFIQRILTIEPDNCSAPIVAEYQAKKNNDNQE